MRYKKYFILTIVFGLIVLCCALNCGENTLVSETLFDVYYGFNAAEGRLSGYTICMNTGICLTMLSVGCKQINDMYKMYNMTAVRCRGDNSLFRIMLLPLIGLCVIGSVIFTAVHIGVLMLFGEMPKSSVILIPVCFALSFMIWFCIIGILFAFKIRYNHIFFIMLTVAVFSPVINLYDVPVAVTLVPFPTDFLISASAYIGKAVLMLGLGAVWRCSLKRYESLT